MAEGRIEPSDGTLMCSYHGWRFNGEGACTDIPQSLDAKANAAACSNPRSCAISHPTKVQTLLSNCAHKRCTRTVGNEPVLSARSFLSAEVPLKTPLKAAASGGPAQRTLFFNAGCS